MAPSGRLGAGLDEALRRAFDERGCAIALACAVAVIRWEPDASSDKLRAGARCTSCGSKGATLQHPGWAGNHIGFCPFPTGIIAATDDRTRVLGAAVGSLSGVIFRRIVRSAATPSDIPIPPTQAGHPTWSKI